MRNPDFGSIRRRPRNWAIAGFAFVATVIPVLAVLQSGPPEGSAVARSSDHLHQHATLPQTAATNPRPNAHVRWARPRSLKEMVNASAGVAWGEVTDVKQGDGLRSIGSGDAPTLPTQRVFFQRLELLKGDLPEKFEVLYVGGPGFMTDEDPPYRVGERYVMFLKPNPMRPGRYLRVAIDGRLKQIDKHFEGFVPGGPSGELQGL